MASVPNTRPGPAPLVPGAPLPILVAGAGFASLLPAAPEGTQPPAPVAPSAEGIAAETGSKAAETAEPDPQADAADLVALLPVTAPTPAAPPPAMEAPIPADLIPPAKAPAEPVAKAPVRPAPASVSDVPQAAQQRFRKPEEAPKPVVPDAPIDPEVAGRTTESSPPADKAIETAKRAIEQALRHAPPVQAPAPGRAPGAIVRPPDAPAEAETVAAAENAAPFPAAPPPLPAAAAPAPALAAAPQPGEAPDRVVERALDLARDGEWLDRLARDIARTAEGDAPMRFRLHPQTLGHMRVELAQGDHGTSVRLTVETEAARAILADAQPRLAAEARAQGVRIAETHVDLSDSGRHASGDQRRQDETRQTPIIRTAREPAQSGAAPVQPARSRSDRYA